MPRFYPSEYRCRVIDLIESGMSVTEVAGGLEVTAATIHRVLVRHGVNRLKWMDRTSGRVIRRVEASRCRELIHIDVKKLAHIPDGGGHKKGSAAGLVDIRFARQCRAGRMYAMPKMFPLEFKRDVVAVARRGDLTRTEAAADFGISEST